MFKAATLFLLLLLSLSPLSLTSPSVKRDVYPNPAPCTGNCVGWLHDPVVAISPNGTYYRFTTIGGIIVATAPSIRGPWTPTDAVFPNGTSIYHPSAGDQIWAPDVHELNGTYYLYYSVPGQPSQLGVATSASMAAGTWTDRGAVNVPNDTARYNKIDPNLLRVENSTSGEETLLLSFGSFTTDIYQIRMASPPLSIAPGAQPVHLEFNGTARPKGPDLLPSPSEGSYQFAWASNGTVWYYLFFSSGNCCNEPDSGAGLAPQGEEYKVMVCRSRDPSSGFVDRDGTSCLQSGGTEILASHGVVYAPGGQGVMWAEEESSVVIYYHYVNTSLSYKQDEYMFGWNRLDFSGGWPVLTE